MKVKNYLPFGLREILTVGGQNFPAGIAPTTSSIQVQSFDINIDGNKVILGDLSVYAYQAEQYPSTQLLMRVGWLGKGYLLEKRIPAGLFINKSRPGVPVWKLPKPYILWPNQKLRARLNNLQDYDGSLGIAFHGRRMVDDRPIIIYDTSEQQAVVNTPVGFSDATLKAPGDSPVEIHSVAVSQWTYARAQNSMEQQIWSPKGREWFQATPLAGPPPPDDQRWIDPPTGLFELGEENGWEIGTGQTFLVEFENLGANDMTVMTTLRGCVEVEEEYHG